MKIREFLFSPVGVAFLILTGVWACMAATFPAFPVDETRYLTVAWEMRHSGQWMLPTLNGEPYSHKPPLLFWLINLVWSVTGPSVGAARIVSLCVATAVFFLTAKFAKDLFPDNALAARLTPLLLLASPPFMIYGNMIMFDFLLYACVLGALICLWRAGHERSARPWILFGLAMGMAVLAKGPVILVHLMPPALLAPFLWQTVYTKKEWYLRVAGGVLMAVMIGLAWAVPAAIIGGREFAHMIFWGQSAGRMVNAFDHRRPVWFYLPLLPLFMLPWLFTRVLWQGIKEFRTLSATPSIKFVLSWIIPAFIAFSLISGKQPHYLVPLTSGLALLAAAAMAKAAPGNEGKTFPATILLYVLAFGAFACAPLLPLIVHNSSDHILSDGLNHFSAWPFIIAGIASLAVIMAARKSLEGRVLAMAASTGLLLCLTTLQAQRHLYQYFDLRPLAPVLAPYLQSPIAFMPKYAGEIGFTAGLAKPLDVIDKGGLDTWLAVHPGAVAVVRHDNYETLPQYDTLYSMAYRGDQRISVVKQK